MFTGPFLDSRAALQANAAESRHAGEANRFGRRLEGWKRSEHALAPCQRCFDKGDEQPTNTPAAAETVKNQARRCEAARAGVQLLKCHLQPAPNNRKLPFFWPLKVRIGRGHRRLLLEREMLYGAPNSELLH